jgi:glycosyltransferase involved in cell wall biosynthesis
MKVGFLIRRLGFGGAERQLICLAAGLVKRGHEIVVFTYYQNELLDSDLLREGVRLVCLDKAGRWETLTFLYRLIRNLRKENLDILHSFSISTNVLGRISIYLVNPKPKLVWRIATSYLDYSKYDFSAKLLSWVERALSRTVPLVVSNSYAGRKYALETGFKSPSIEVIPNGISISNPRLTPVLIKDVRKQWGVPAGSKLVGIVGRIDPIKGYEIFIHAAKKINEQSQSTYFLCVGDGPSDYLASLKAMVQEYNLESRFIWLSASKDVHKIISCLDVLACPSLGEGFPNVVAEGLLCGVLTVASDVGDVAKIIPRDDFVVKNLTGEHLAIAINKALDTIGLENLEYCLLCQKLMVKHYSVDRYVDQTEKLLMSYLLS